MDKVLGQDKPVAKRTAFLKDNCDKIEEIGYMKQFSPDEISSMKDELSEVAIEINDISIEKKEVMKEFKARMDPLEDQKTTLLKHIKTKAEWVKEECYKFIDHEERMVGFYNAEGVLVEARPVRPEESQLTIRMSASRTGTDN